MPTKTLDLESSSTQYVTRADEALLDITGDMTIEGWVRLESYIDNAVFVGKFTSAGDQRSFNFHFITSGQMRAYICNDGTNANTSKIQISTTAVRLNTWTHIAIVYDASAGEVKYYLNGNLDRTTTGHKTSIFNSTSPFVIGDQSVDFAYYDGLVSSVRLFSDIRTQAEIITDAFETTVSDANLVGEWSLDDTYADTSGNGLTLTAVNSPVFSTTVWGTIVFDAVTAVSAVTGTSLTFSATVGAGFGNHILFVQGHDTSGGSSLVTGVTYAGAAMTKVTGVQVTLDRWITIWYLIAPSTGTNDVVVTASGSTALRFSAIAYTGAKQSGQPDGSDTSITVAGTTISTDITTTANNCWMLMFGKDNAGGNTYTTSTGDVFRLNTDAGGQFLLDTSAFISPAGANTMTATGSLSNIAAIGVSFAPAETAPATNTAVIPTPGGGVAVGGSLMF